ncbi:MAG: hypothetical protein C0483_19885 [Pirellula sp.]|nr:hypothetical protein [Pirellula sp.]
MSHNLELATRSASHAGVALQDPVQDSAEDSVAELDARFDAVEALLRQCDDGEFPANEPAAPSPAKREPRRSRRTVATAVRRAMWRLAAHPQTVDMIQEAITARPVPCHEARPIAFGDVLQLLAAQPGLRPLLLRPRHPVGRAIGVIDQRLGRLVLVVESAPDDTARFRLPAVRSPHVEGLLQAAFGLAF